MSNVVSWIKYIYTIYNPVIKRFYFLLLNHSEYKAGIIMISIFLFVIAILYFLNKYTQKRLKPNYDNDNKKRNKLFLLTELNTLINKVIPMNFDTYKSYYLRVLGNDFHSIYPRIFSSIKKNYRKLKNKKNKNKVSFDESNINFMI